MLRIHEIKLGLEEDISAIPGHIIKKLGMKKLVIREWRPVKESIDAREKTNIRRVYSVDFTVEQRDGVNREETEREVLRTGEKRRLKIGTAPDMEYHFVTESLKGESESGAAGRKKLAHPPVVAGFGPCGMFAALLLAQMGYRPLVLERGKAIEERILDVERFWKDGVLDPESNVQFGEGGAGSFSDGKLTTQIKDSRIRKVLSELVLAGGGEELLYKQKPHVGTDVLREVVRNIRREILRLGGRIEFESRLTGLRFAKGDPDARENGEPRRVLSAVEISGREGKRILETDVAVLALGHSARDTFRALYEQGVPMEQKPFSMGARIEHPQAMVDLAQYGTGAGARGLSAADYKLSWRCADGRGVYTFCMCPGGQVIASASQEGGVVTNGMSYRDRGMENANSALLVDVRTEDFGSDHPLAGVAFQEKYERLAFEVGGGAYRAPAQRVGHFLLRKATPADGESADVWVSGGLEAPGGPGAAAETGRPEGVRPSYEPGVTWTSLDLCLPDFVTRAMREALPQLGKKLKGFDRPDAVLTGVETRSSSPVRIPRDQEMTCGVRGLYPGGEGAGYAGGITSAAVDGIRIAEAIAVKYRPACAPEEGNLSPGDLSPGDERGESGNG